MNDFSNHERANHSEQLFQKPNISNNLQEYIAYLSPEMAKQLSRPSLEVVQIIQENIAQTLGGLPPQQFHIAINTDGENLKQLLVSAMMTGYFLKSAENRIAIERSLSTEK